MGSLSAKGELTNSGRIRRFVSHVTVFTVLSFPLSCGPDSSDPIAVAGAAGTTLPTSGGAAGTSAGGSASPGSGGVLQSGGAPSGGTAPGSAGTPSAGSNGAGAPGSGGSSGSSPTSGGSPGNGGTAGALQGGSAPVAGGPAQGGAGGTGGEIPANPLAHLAASAKEIGLRLANRFSQQTLSYSSVANLPGDGYKNACEWYGALGVAKFTASQDLLTALVKKFDPLKTNFVSAMTGGEAHVDRYIYGAVPLEIYLQTGDESYKSLGTQCADRQQTTNQVRNAIDDMFMMTILQVEAYRATKDAKYIDFMSKTMVDYLKAQQSNGLFFHNVTEARVHWGRGNGWFAAGMAEVMRDLPKTSANYATIEAGYKKMMEGLKAVQGPNGLWYQVLDQGSNANNWEETSGSAMFTYSMIAGVRSGVLDAATYVPVIEAAWAGLQKKISATGEVSDICIGTWYKASAQEYMALTRLKGDGHGQAPVLWAAAELLR